MNRQWEETVKEIEDMRQVIAKTTDIYTANAIDRLIMARLKLERLNQEGPKSQPVNIRKLSDDALKYPPTFSQKKMEAKE